MRENLPTLLDHDGTKTDTDNPDTERRRVELLGSDGPRRTIDAGWSKSRKRAVAIGLGSVAITAIGIGVWVWQSGRPPALPTTADEAVAIINSARFDRLDESRKKQYLAEAERLLQGIPDEQRRALFEDDEARDAMGQIMRNRMDDLARRLARGEEIDMPFGPPGPRGQRLDPDSMPQEFRDMMRQRINQQLAQQINSGNAQNSGLRIEMMQQMRGGRP